MVHFLILFSLLFSDHANAAFFTQSDILINGNSPASSNPLGIRLTDGTSFLTSLPVKLQDGIGTSISSRADGFLHTQNDPTTLLFDTFETLDTTNTWVIGGTAAPTGTSGSLSVAPGTAANASSYGKSIPVFTPGASAYLQFAALVQVEAAVITGNTRVWGVGAYVTPTNSVPITNGTVFEIDSATGNLFASVYSNSVRTQTVALVKPTDATTHRYAIYYKASRTYFEIDNVQVASISFPNPQVSALSTVIGSINGASALASTPVLNSSLIGLGDTGRNASKISDGIYPWRMTQVTSAGALRISNRGNFQRISTATTIVLKSGSGTLKRICLNTGGNGSTMTLYDNTAASGTVIALISVGSSTPFGCSTYDLILNNGLTVVTVSAVQVSDWTVVWE